MCKTLISNGIKGFHFYTLNLERSVRMIIDGLGLVSNKVRPLPWRQSVDECRLKEDVRPIFWKHRPQSYIRRTEFWDEFPNGRWGDSRSPAFGDVTDFHLGVTSHAVKKSHYSTELNDIDDIARTFIKYCQGEIKELPWNDQSLSVESETIKDQLIRLNSNGLLTINSQPKVNGASSSDPIHGWGRPNGWVYQKAYVEFFVSEEMLHRLLKELGKHKFLTYHAINRKGDKVFTNTEGANALTWGVFPGCEIQQPTIVDAGSFSAWKDEAFALWNTWANQYAEDSESFNLIKRVQKSWFLMNVVDNDFQNGNIFSYFEAVIDNGVIDH